MPMVTVTWHASKGREYKHSPTAPTSIGMLVLAVTVWWRWPADLSFALFQANSSSTILAKPVPHTGIPFQPKLPHQHTVPEPFTVEERSKMMLAQKEEKIKQILEEERRVSRVHPSTRPCFSPCVMIASTKNSAEDCYSPVVGTMHVKGSDAKVF